MTLLTKIGISAGIALVLSGMFLLWKRSYDNARRLEGKLEILAVDLLRRDSVLADFLGTLGTRLDTQALTTTKTIERWNTITQVIPGTTRVDSVFKDSVFAALPDSLKVRVLTQLGTQVAQECSAFISTCQTYKDSAQRQFVIKDSLLRIANLRTQVKPRRPCGIGGTAGPSAGVMRFLGDTARTWRLAWGFGGSIGLTCSF